MFNNYKNNTFLFKILFLIFAIFVYRAGSYIPVSCVDVKKLTYVFESNFNNIFNLFNLFSGGALSRVSIFTLGVVPYISSSIIIQLLSFFIPYFLQLKKEGQYGYKKVIVYTRYLTVIVAFIQSFAMAYYLIDLRLVSIYIYFIIFITTVVCGSVFLMWLCEQITERGIGNGISIIIFIGIISNLPVTISSTFEKARQNELEIFSLLILCLVVFFVLFFVVFIECAKRKISINHAKRQLGRKIYASNKSYLPLKINMAGVIPPIFTSSLLLFPSSLFHILTTWFPNSKIFDFFSHSFIPGHFLYMFFYIIGVIFFCFFYTRLIFNSTEIAENLKKSGAFLFGIRPGKYTADYINGIVNKLTFLSSLYLSFISLVPELLIYVFNVPFYFGGTSLLIVVIVILEFINQVQINLLSSKYEKLLKRSSTNTNDLFI